MRGWFRGGIGRIGGRRAPAQTPEGGAEESDLPSDGVEAPAPARKPLELEECESVSVPAELSMLERRRAGKSELVAAAFS